jgi:hypothetical protein
LSRNIISLLCDVVSPLVVRCRKGIIDRAKIIPRLRSGILPDDVRRVLGKDNGETELEVPVNVAESHREKELQELSKENVPVEEPRASVVCAEADRDVVAGCADADHVAAGRVDVVVG